MAVTKKEEKPVMVTEPEVPEVIIETPVVEEVKKEAPAPPPVLEVAAAPMTKEEKILDFLTKKGSGGFVRLNEFLKSTYPVPKAHEQAAWLAPSESKAIKALLAKLENEGQITVHKNYLKLGTNFYSGVEQKRGTYDLNSVLITAKMGVDV